MNSIYRLIALSILLFFSAANLVSQPAQTLNQIPPVYTGIMRDSNGLYYHMSVTNNDTSWHDLAKTYLTPNHLMSPPTGYSDGLSFDFKASDFYGTLYYGVYPLEFSNLLFPVYSKSARIIAGKAQINLKPFIDPSSLQDLHVLKVFYRLVDQYGQLLYDGSVRIENNLPIIPLLSIMEGPFINNLDEKSVVISFLTNQRCSASVLIDGREFSSLSKTMNLKGEVVHEIKIEGLLPDTQYTYIVRYGDISEGFEFATPPISGSRRPFSFAFSSNSRGTAGGGEWDLGGVNVKCLKSSMALASMENAAFFQVSGNLIKGYTSDPHIANQQYHNWKKAVEWFGRHKPIYTAMGNHDVVNMVFSDGSKYGLAVDYFPFGTQSSEAVFARHFVNPVNGPKSEDGVDFDPYPDKLDFPEYNENVYSYRYDNLAVIVLNTSYWTSTSNKAVRQIGGNPSGYIMYNQLQWVKTTVAQFEKDQTIDHIIVVMNSPPLPMGDNRGMWYNGNNFIRPVVAAIPVDEGIIERRDELLDILVNQNTKIELILTSTEGYHRLEVSPRTSIYHDGYGGKKLKIKRTLSQVSCGLISGGELKNKNYPWSESIKKFSDQPAVVFVQINGDHLSLKVLNPISLQEIETVVLR